MLNETSPAIRFAAMTLASVLCVGGSRAQSARAPTEPSAPHEALSFFEGAWTTADAKPEDEFRETCAWLAEGRRHMICRSRWLTAAGLREGLSIFSFDPATNEYLYHGFRAAGAVVTQRGTRTQSGWHFGSDRGIGSDRVRTRVTIERNSEQGFNFLSETANGEGPWSVAATVVYRRLVP